MNIILLRQFHNHSLTKKTTNAIFALKAELCFRRGRISVRYPDCLQARNLLIPLSKTSETSYMISLLRQERFSEVMISSSEMMVFTGPSFITLHRTLSQSCVPKTVDPHQHSFFTSERKRDVVQVHPPGCLQRRCKAIEDVTFKNVVEFINMPEQNVA